MTGAGRTSLLQALGVVLVGLAGRALIDKLLALRGGAELVAHWAQLTSLSDLVSGVALAGIGVGLTGRLGGLPSAARHRLGNEALRLGLTVSAATFGACALLLALSRWRPVPGALEMLVLPALAAGTLAVAPGMLSAWLLGVGRPLAAMGLAAAILLVPLAALGMAPPRTELPALLAAQCALGLAICVWRLREGGSWRAGFVAGHPLRPFIGAGLTIGILSPLATVLARQEIAGSASWETAGEVQALWRSSEWVTAIAAGLLYSHFLPRMGAAADAAALRREMRAAARVVLVPALLALLSLWLLLPEVLALLYRPDLAVPRGAALPFIAGDGLRMLSWIFLFALYARGAGRAVTLGEFLSLPLFVLLVACLPAPVRLHQVGVCWLLAYAAYAAFNAWMLRRELGDRGGLTTAGPGSG